MYPDLNTWSQGFFNLHFRIWEQGRWAWGTCEKQQSRVQAVLLKARREPWRIESVQVPFFEPPTVTKVNDKDLKRVQCLLCTEQIADGGGTSNLMSHLQAKHLEEYKRYTNDSSKTVRHRVHSIASCECVGAHYRHHKAYCWVCHVGSLPYQCCWWAGLLGWSLLPLSKLGGWSCVYPAVVRLLYI